MSKFWSKYKAAVQDSKDQLIAKSYAEQIKVAVLKCEGVCITCNPTRAQFNRMAKLFPSSWYIIPVFKNDEDLNTDVLEFISVGINLAALWFGWCDFKRMNKNNKSLTVVQELILAKAESIIRTFLVKDCGIKLLED